MLIGVLSRIGFTNSSSNTNISTAGLQSSSFMSALKKIANQLSKKTAIEHCALIDVCPEVDCSPAVEMSAFDDESVKPIRGW